jgi:hypothetical protein
VLHLYRSEPVLLLVALRYDFALCVGLTSSALLFADLEGGTLL